MTHPSRLLLIELPGASVDLLRSLAESGVTPNVGTLLGNSAVGRLRDDGPTCAMARWATLHCGGGAQLHGLLDDVCLDRRRRWVRPVSRTALPCPGLSDLATPSVHVGDVSADGSLWRAKPGSFEELSDGIGRTIDEIKRTVDAAEEADRRGPWRLLAVRFGVFDPLLHRLWSTLGIGDSPGGNRQWVGKTREAFSALDACLGRLFELATRRDAAVALASPFGFGPPREKITVNELLRRGGLLQVASGAGRLAYRLHRFGWKARRTLLGDRSSRPVRGWLPIDWGKSRAVALHGQAAALVYLNTRERFGTRALATAAEREQAIADTVAALGEARHSTTDEPLFVDVYRTDDRDPIARGLPEVVGVPAPGFLVRHRLDRNGRVLRTDASLAATRYDEGSLVIHAPNLVPPGEFTADLVDVAPTILQLLGLPPGDRMTGRALPGVTLPLPSPAAGQRT